MSQAFKSERYSEIIYGLFICFFAHVLCGHMIRNWKKNNAGMSNREWHWYYEVLSLCQMRTPKQLHSQVSEPNLYNTLQPESAHCCRAIVPPSSPSPADRSGALCVFRHAVGHQEAVSLCCRARALPSFSTVQNWVAPAEGSAGRWWGLCHGSFWALLHAVER